MDCREARIMESTAMTPEDEWMTTEEVAEWLKVPARTVRSWRVRSVGPVARKIGRHIRYQREDVTEWILSGQSADTGRRAIAEEPAQSLIRPPRRLRR